MGEVYYLKNPNNPPVAIGTIQKVGGVWEYYISNPNQSPLKVSKSLWISQFLEGNLAQPIKINSFYSKATDLDEGTLNPAYNAESNLYELRIKTNLLVNIPQWVEDKLRYTLKSVGWLLSNIHIDGGEYVFQLEKVSSITFGGMVAIIIGILIFAGVITVSWTLKNISDNKVTLSSDNNAQLQNFLDIVNQNPDISPSDKSEIYENISKSYFEGSYEIKDDKGGITDFFNKGGIDISTLALVGLIAFILAKK